MGKLILGLVLLLAVACGGSQPSSTAVSSPVAPASVGVATDPKYGQFLVDGSGRALYLFEQDKTTSSTCYADCAKYWPPLLTGGTPQASNGVNASLLGTTKRSDGSLEVTYAGHPLYYVITDHNPGDTTGQGVNNFGAPWDLVSPDGRSIG